MRHAPAYHLNLHYSVAVCVLHSIDVDMVKSVDVVGDPDNGCYEWVIRTDQQVVTSHSDVGYGSPATALRDGLIAYMGLPETEVQA